MGRPTQAGDATDQWRGRWNAAIVCPTQWRLPAGWLPWIVDVDKPSVEGHPKQCNRLDSSPGCLGATCEARWTWRSHAAGTSVCSWLCVMARRPAAECRHPCKMPALYSCRMWQLLWTITETINTSFLVIFLKRVVTEVVLFSIVALKTMDISQGSVATHLMYGGIFSDSIITHFLLIMKWNNFENRLIFDEVKAYQKTVPFLGHPVLLGLNRFFH